MQYGSGRWVFVITVFVRFAPMRGIYLLKKPGLALKNPPKKTHPKNPKKPTLKNPLKMFFLGFLDFF
jgi:hypothetical protein